MEVNDKHFLELKLGVLEERIIYSKNTFGFGPSDYFVALGSSVGFWFGLSVLGITDQL